MASLRRAAKNSLLTIDSEDATAGRAWEIAQQTRLYRRTGLALIDAMAHNHPKLLSRALGLKWQEPPFEVFSSGWQSTVYRVDDETVLKVVDDSVLMSRGEQRKRVKEMRDEHAALASFVGPAVLPHEVEIGSHPSLPNERVITITQEYRDVHFLQLNEETEGIPVLAERLRQAYSNYPAILDEMTCVINGSRALYEERQLSTDIIGRDNIGVETGTGSLILVDGQPITPRNAPTQEAMSMYFDNLASAVRLAA